jgi:hypothetical protein
LIDNKKTVFVLGAGASCPYGYPSGARLRQRVCLSQGFIHTYTSTGMDRQAIETRLPDIKKFKDAFNKSRIESIDLFMANNPKLAPIGKYIIAFEILMAEQQSLSGEEAKLTQEMLAFRESNPRDRLSEPFFKGEDWYFYLYNRLIEGLVGKNTLPDFSNGNLAFITFNYDRSLEQFFYESLSNSFTEVSEPDIIKCLKKLKIMHVYGQIAPLKWQDSEQGIDYKPKIGESLLEGAAANIKTIYEQKKSPVLDEAIVLLAQADEIFFLGFGYAPENMEVLRLSKLIPPKCQVYGTAFNMIGEEVNRLYSELHGGRARDKDRYMQPTSTLINDVDCLMLLRKYLN